MTLLQSLANTRWLHLFAIIKLITNYYNLGLKIARTRKVITFIHLMQVKTIISLWIFHLQWQHGGIKRSRRWPPSSDKGRCIPCVHPKIEILKMLMVLYFFFLQCFFFKKKLKDIRGSDFFPLTSNKRKTRQT
jgi:hypothetical protein